MKYFLYKTVNKINDKFYIGVHQTEDINDGYLGSSLHLDRAINKYGKENFKREILHLTTCKWETKYLEAVEQINRKVLLDDEYWNGILNLRIGKCPKALKSKYK